MSDPELATRAPENDAMEDTDLKPQRTNTADLSLSPSELNQPDPQPQSQSQSQSQTTTQPLGEHCTTDRPTPSHSPTPKGTLSTLSGIQTYITKPPSYPSSPAKLLLLLTGGTGVHSKNNQLQADLFASKNYIVIMPDQFSSDPAPSAATTATSAHDSGGTASTFLEAVKSKVVETAKSFTIDMWLARHTPERVLPILHKVIEAAREEFGDAIEHGGGIYGVGYCFGARYIVILAGEHPDSVSKGQALASSAVGGSGEDAGGGRGMVKSGPFIKAGAVAHATLVEKEELRGVKSPLFVVAVKDDPLFPEEVLEYGKKVWASSQDVKCEVQVVEGVPHGFAVVGEYEDENIRRRQGEAFEGMCGWLERY